MGSVESAHSVLKLDCTKGHFEHNVVDVRVAGMDGLKRGMGWWENVYVIRGIASKAS